MIISLSRWVNEDSSVGFVRLEATEVLSGLHIVHFVDLSASERAVSRALQGPVGEGIYTYDRVLTVEERTVGETEPDMERQQPPFFDRFQVWQGEELLVDFASNSPDVHEELTPGSTYEVPKTAWETRAIKNTVYRLWTHMPSTPFRRKVSFMDAVPSATSAIFVNVTVADDRLFEDCMNPKKSTQEDIDSMLADPLMLFQGATGRAFIVESEGVPAKVVIPLSDGVRTWKEEFPRDLFITTTLTRAPGKFYTTTIHDFKPVAEVTMSTIVSNSYRHNSTEVPSTLRSGLALLEDGFNDSTVLVPRYNFGNGDGRGLSTDGYGGITYGSDNFTSWAG